MGGIGLSLPLSVQSGLLKIPPYKHILILADIEGSSGCASYRASSFLTRPWASACVDMSRDVNCVVKALFDAGVIRVTVKDFHRTAYNLLPEMIDSRIRLVSGYRMRPVYGVGDPGDADAVMMIGMHAASGTDGFLPHTLTSRLAGLLVNGRPMTELELFAASLAPLSIPPIFFSGCLIACDQARERIPEIHTFPIDKQGDPGSFDADRWRHGLVQAAVQSLSNNRARPYRPNGPFHAEITIRDGASAAIKMAKPWGFTCHRDQVYLDEPDLVSLYRSLIRLCYLSPAVEKTLPLSLFLYNLIGWLGRVWVRWALP